MGCNVRGSVGISMGAAKGNEVGIVDGSADGEVHSLRCDVGQS